MPKQFSRRALFQFAAGAGALSIVRAQDMVNNQRAAVSLVKGEDRRKNICEALEAIDDQIRPVLKRKKYVVIKPNNVSTRNQLAATHADTLRGILDYLAPRFKGPIVIAESSAGDTMNGFENFKYTQVAAEHRSQKVSLVDLNAEAKYNVIDLIDYDLHAIPVRLAARLMDPDAFIICSAILKTHNIVVATLSVKNMTLGAPLHNAPKETTKWNDKRKYHNGVRQTHYNMFLTAKALKPFWGATVIDGYEGMEGNGPGRRHAGRLARGHRLHRLRRRRPRGRRSHGRRSRPGWATCSSAPCSASASSISARSMCAARRSPPSRRSTACTRTSSASFSGWARSRTCRRSWADAGQARPIRGLASKFRASGNSLPVPELGSAGLGDPARPGPALLRPRPFRSLRHHSLGLPLLPLPADCDHGGRVRPRRVPPLDALHLLRHAVVRHARRRAALSAHHPGRAAQQPRPAAATCCSSWNCNSPRTFSWRACSRGACCARSTSGPAAALTGATIFQLGAYFASQTQHLGAINAAAWMPLAWEAVILLARGFTFRRLAVLVAALAMSLLAGFPAVTAVVWGSTLLLALALAPARGRATSRLARVWAAAVSAVQLLPTLELTGLSVAGRRSQFMGAGGGVPLEALVSLVWPNRWGVFDFDPVSLAAALEPYLPLSLLRPAGAGVRRRRALARAPGARRSSSPRSPPSSRC